jgi:hypothetical protein
METFYLEREVSLTLTLTQSPNPNPYPYPNPNQTLNLTLTQTLTLTLTPNPHPYRASHWLIKPRHPEAFLPLPSSFIIPPQFFFQNDFDWPSFSLGFFYFLGLVVVLLSCCLDLLVVLLSCCLVLLLVWVSCCLVVLLLSCCLVSCSCLGLSFLVCPLHITRKNWFRQTHLRWHVKGISGHVSWK